MPIEFSRSVVRAESRDMQPRRQPTHPFLVRWRLELDKHGHIQPSEHCRLGSHGHEIPMVQIEFLLLQGRRLLPQSALQLQFIRREHCKLNWILPLRFAKLATSASSLTKQLHAIIPSMVRGPQCCGKRVGGRLFGRRGKDGPATIIARTVVSFISQDARFKGSNHTVRTYYLGATR